MDLASAAACDVTDDCSVGRAEAGPWLAKVLLRQLLSEYLIGNGRTRGLWRCLCCHIYLKG